MNTKMLLGILAAFSLTSLTFTAGNTHVNEQVAPNEKEVIVMAAMELHKQIVACHKELEAARNSNDTTAIDTHLKKLKELVDWIIEFTRDFAQKFSSRGGVNDLEFAQRLTDIADSYEKNYYTQIAE